MLPADASWPQAAGALPLAEGEIHVWRVGLTLTAEEENLLVASLPADEQARASRYLALPARQQFVAARSALRSILSHYLNCPADEVAFDSGPLGKPALANGGPRPLYFNLSHSRELALVAVTRCGEIGVDVELVRDMPSRDALAARFFHPNEVAALNSLDPRERASGFFNAWTRKEAFLKATGKGISYGIDRVEVTLIPGKEPQVLSIDGDRAAAKAWSLVALVPAPDYVGAVAIKQRRRRIVHVSYESSMRAPNQ